MINIREYAQVVSLEYIHTRSYVPPLKLILKQPQLISSHSGGLHSQWQLHGQSHSGH